ncbi:uncharacterized protein LOC119094849 isoform X2 [Pollicipes pollicipes]|uniref:uncharacterized protein LOC119094849 isoform X2 n=1 Tax=Pollicipes pollicipes TaxID=41117 RepID=UPI001884A157|nr:uncharacterized protein LOC119094849 isoform X2 [Pollicipes pollicipes]
MLDIVKDLGVITLQRSDLTETTTSKSIIDTILDELKDLVDRYLPIIGPLAGLTREQTKAIKENFDKFVVDVEGMEHGTVEIADGVIDICIDILHVLEAFDVDVTVPTTDGTTTLDEVLFWLEDGLNAVLDIVGPFIGMDYDKIKATEADLHTLINDIRSLGDGHIDVDHGLEAILTDILQILKDFGVPTVHSNEPVNMHSLLHTLEHQFAGVVTSLNKSLPMPDALMTTLETDVHQLVMTIKTVTQNRLEDSNAVESMLQDMVKIVNDVKYIAYLTRH